MPIIESVCYPGTTDPVMEGDLVQGIGMDDGERIGGKKGIIISEVRRDIFTEERLPWVKVRFNSPLGNLKREWGCYAKNLKLLKRKKD